jgi:hypothetical protein
MSKIMIKCLRTDRAVPTGMATDDVTWKKLAANWRGEPFLCPACDMMHEWLKSDAFLQNVSRP